MTILAQIWPTFLEIDYAKSRYHKSADARDADCQLRAEGVPQFPDSRTRKLCSARPEQIVPHRFAIRSACQHELLQFGSLRERSERLRQPWESSSPSRKQTVRTQTILLPQPVKRDGSSSFLSGRNEARTLHIVLGSKACKKCSSTHFRSAKPGLSATRKVLITDKMTWLYGFASIHEYENAQAITRLRFGRSGQVNRNSFCTQQHLSVCW